MKSAFLAAVLSLLSVSTTNAFCVSPAAARLPMRTSASRAGAASLAMNAEPTSRKALLEQGLVGLAGLLAVSAPASAGLFGNDQKFPGVLDPRDAIKDAEKLGSDKVKSDIDTLMKYRSNLKDIASVLEKDPQADILPQIKDTFQFAKFRAVLNEVNDVFDEDTQRGTDLIVRNMLQDALELANAAKLKQGVPRSERKEEVLQKKLAKLEQAFQRLSEYI